MTNTTHEQLQLAFGSEFPTERAPERAANAAKAAAQALSKAAQAAQVIAEDVWCDSEAPTGIEAERPVFPPSPRPPSL